MTRTSLATVLALLLGSLVPGAALGSDRKPPKMTKAVMVDKDADGFADHVVLNYSEKIKHRVDDDGIYPFRVVGYKITRIGRGQDKQLTVTVVEKAKTDPGAEPNILYDRGRDTAVYDVSRNEALTQTFKGTKAFVAVPNGSSLLIVNVDGPGSVETLDETFVCATSCYKVFSDTPLLMLFAQADDGATFTGWGGACSGSGTQSPCTLTLDSDKSVDAAFE